MYDRPRKILVLSIWEKLWSMGEGSGVPDELHFIRHLSERGIDIHYLIPRPVEKSKAPENSRLSYHTYPNILRTIDHLPGPVKHPLQAAVLPLLVTGKLRDLAAEIKPDLILGYSHHSLYPLNRVGRKFGIPTVAKFFGVMYLGRFDLPSPKYWWLNFDQVLALRFPVDHYVVLNDGTRGKMALTRLGIPSEKISFLPNGMSKEWIDLHVDATEVRRSMGFPTEDILIVTFARLVKSKRTELFIEAASRIDPALMDRVSFVVGGDGPERERLERKVRSLGLGDKVIFAGVIPYRDIARFLKASDIFVGTNELTNMSMPPCEAILCGVPVVAFDVPGTSEVVRDGETGLLARDGDIEGLARKIELLVRNDELRKRLGTQAADFARKNFVSWDERVGMELKIIEGLFKRNTRT